MGDLGWSLSSSRGMEFLECEVVSDVGREMVCHITIVGEYWDRGREGVRVVVEDFRVVLPQIVMAREALEGLERAFADWLKEERSFSCMVQPGDGGGQVLELSLGHDLRFVRSAHKAVFTLNYCSGLVMTSNFSFLVDQSCVQLAMEGIAGCLLALPPERLNR